MDPTYVIPSLKMWLNALDWNRIKPFRGIVIHHSATPDYPGGHSWDAIKRFHMAPTPYGNGWADIGYHMGLEEAGGVLQFLAGRPMYEYGAHALNYNAGDHATIGICCVGDYDLVPPSPDRWWKLAFMCKELRSQFKARRGVDLFVMGHRETYAPNPPQKTCPGTAFDMGAFRKAVLQ